MREDLYVTLESKETELTYYRNDLLELVRAMDLESMFEPANRSRGLRLYYRDMVKLQDACTRLLETLAFNAAYGGHTASWIQDMATSLGFLCAAEMASDENKWIEVFTWTNE